MSLYFGIDFGTSTNFITKWNESTEKVEPVANLGNYNSGKDTFANVIYYPATGHPIIGDAALKQYNDDPDNGVYAIKRHIGEEAWSCKIPHLGKSLTAEEVVRDIFHCIKEKLMSQNAGNHIDGVVISVPYAFQSRERNIIKNAAEKAGFHVRGLIEEPVAAALSFGIFDSSVEIGMKEKVLIFDLGGGTFDITIFEFEREQENFKIEVLNTDGEKALGGNDVDELLKKYFVNDILKVPVEERNPKAESKFLRQARRSKEELSYEDETDVFEVYDTASKSTYDNNGIELDYPLKRKEFEDLLDPFLSKIRNCLEDAIYDADLEPADIDKIVLVGGSSNIPAIQRDLKKFFGKEPLSTGRSDELVGRGAGIYCGVLLGQLGIKLKIVPKTSYAIGIREGTKFKKVLPKNSKYEQFSEIEYCTIEGNKNHEAEVEIYQGNSSDITKCCKAGKIIIDISAFPKNRVGICLGTDQSGNICYRLHINEHEVVAQGKII